MDVPTQFSYQRYLAAKKSIDDRSLNQHVWKTFWEELPPSPSQYPLEILELGAGIGTMIERIIDTNMLNHALYTALDQDPNSIGQLEQSLDQWAARKPFLQIIPYLGSAQQFIAENQNSEHGPQLWDVVLANAFLDLLPLNSFMPQLFSLLPAGGLFYFTVNFDGATIFQPTFDADLDAHIEKLYHKTMDDRIIDGQRSGDSQTGRHLFEHIRQSGAEISSAGSSDWIVHARNGSYPADEAYFLHHILHFFSQSLANHPDLPAADLNAWLHARRSQIANGRLVYIAHQIDMVGKKL